MVLIGIALFAALGFAMSQSSRGSGATLTREMLELHSSEIVEHANNLRNAIMQVKALGCDDEQISFEKSPFDGSDSNYVNLSSPGDFSCHIFHPDGGGMKPKDFPEDIYDPSFTSTARGSSFNADNRVNGIGTSTAAELIYFLTGISPEVCQKINEKLGYGSTMIDDNSIFAGTTYFQGNFEVGDNTFKNVGDGTILEGSTSGCVHELTSCFPDDCYHYYRVLIPK